MIDIQEITRKIIEEKENIVAKAFTVHIGELLKENGIVPVMTEYTKQDIDNVTDASEYKMVTEFGVALKELDTSKHDAKVRAEAIEEFARAYERVELIGCEGCKHLEDDVHCWECIAEQLKEKNK